MDWMRTNRGKGGDSTGAVDFLGLEAKLQCQFQAVKISSVRVVF
jgi:hypothetical protein